MTAIKPIETVYKGYRFRSRLEARWAVFFDNVMVKYEYEPEGFVLDDGTFYLPDFYLPEIDAYVEVKPAGAINISFEDFQVKFGDGREKARKYAHATATIANGHTFIILEGDPIEAFSPRGTGKATAFYMGDCLPGALSYQDPSITCTNGKKCVDCENRKKQFLCAIDVIGFTPKTVIAICLDGSSIDSIPAEPERFDIFLPRAERKTALMDMDEGTFRNYLDVNESAMMEARQARFEHGETPA